MSTDPAPGRPQGKALRAEILPLLLAILAVATVEAAQFEPSSSRWAIVAKVCAIAAVVSGIYRVLSRWGDGGLEPGRLTSGLLIGVALLPVAVEVLQEAVWGTGSPLEILLVSGFRNLACGLAVISYRRSYDRLCCLVSMFLMIFSSAITSDPLAHGMVVVFAVCGVWWLMGIYWDSLQSHLVGATQRQFPKRLLISIPVLFLIALGFLPFAAPQVASALPGWMPTSGGDRWYDPNARSGVNDGEALVPATENARSFGPVDSDIFLESDQPSLYDIFNDTYGTPPKVQKMDRSIGLPPELLKHTHERIAEHKKLGRQFSTVRGSRPQKVKVQKDIDGSALLFVGGRTPLHLGLEVFDLFDGVEWFPEERPAVLPALKLEAIRKQPWVRCSGAGDNDLLSQAESHQLKIINLQTNRIPTPAGMVGVHIDKVDRVDMFGWAQEGILKMERDALPDLTVIHLRSRAADPARLRKERLGVSLERGFHRQLPDHYSTSRVAALAKSWSGDVRGEWQRIEAVMARLRSEYTLDKDYRAPNTCQDTVAEFLFESRRGPDYAFASAAATLLRTMGFSTRVVSGFYADPLKFDTRSRHTPIDRSDVHFWVELYVGSGTWVTLEPTPGFEVLQPPPNLWQKCWQAASAAIGHAYRHIWAYLFGLTLVTAGWKWHVELNDCLTTLLWRYAPVAHPRQQILRTLTLLTRRGQWAGTPRRPGETPSKWLRHLSTQQPDCDSDLLRHFAQASDWAAYAPEHHTIPMAAEIHVVCRKMVSQWTLFRLRRLKQTRPETRQVG
jgi:hypothetical protein